MKMTPNRGEVVKSCALKRYKSTAARVVNLSNRHSLNAVARKVKSEIANICSVLRPSVLRSKDDELNNFNWDSLWLEFVSRMPWLTRFLKQILPQGSKILITFIVCMLLKKNCKHMSLMQRLISVLFYENAASKRVLSSHF